MRWRPTRIAAITVPLVAVLAALQLVLVQPTASAAAAPTKIMALGDSITGSPGCWRALLWQKLTTGGYSNIDFVGTLPAQGCGFTYDGENEGHGGALVTSVANQNQLPAWLAATLPDVVIMHFGTNDVWSNIAPDVILAAYSTLVDQMRASNPGMKILVAQIIPMNPSSCPECAQRTVNLNAAIPAWAAGKTTSASPITVVDQWTGFSTATDTGDGVHPNDAGNVKISDRWYPPLAAALGGTTTSSPASSRPSSASPSSARPSSASPSGSRSASASASSSPPASSAPAGGPSCSVSYAVQSQWAGGFQGGITVTNTSTVTITGWTVTIVFGNGQVVSQVWNGTYTQSGGTVVIRSAPWNGTLAPNASTQAGFIASWTGSNMTPVATCTAV